MIELALEGVGGAADSPAAAVEDVGVDHRRLQVPMAEQLLDGADVVAVLQQVGGEAVTEGMAGSVLDQPGSAHGVPEGALDRGLVEVMSPDCAAFQVAKPAGGGEDVLPAPLARSFRSWAWQTQR